MMTVVMCFSACLQQADSGVFTSSVKTYDRIVPPKFCFGGIDPIKTKNGFKNCERQVTVNAPQERLASKTYLGENMRGMCLGHHYRAWLPSGSTKSPPEDEALVACHTPSPLLWRLIAFTESGRKYTKICPWENITMFSLRVRHWSFLTQLLWRLLAFPEAARKCVKPCPKE